MVRLRECIARARIGTGRSCQSGSGVLFVERVTKSFIDMCTMGVVFWIERWS